MSKLKKLISEIHHRSLWQVLLIYVGGSWVAPKDLVAKGDWAGVEALAREAAKLKPQ